MSEAWIIDACRTPRGIGKKGKGALAEQHPQHLVTMCAGGGMGSYDISGRDVAFISLRG
jgi:acetyl-CoA acetyltransferase